MRYYRRLLRDTDSVDTINNFRGMVEPNILPLDHFNHRL